MNILGIYGAIDWDANVWSQGKYTTWLHDSGATLFIDGKHICSILEERLTRFKNEGNFPEKSIQYCLESGNISYEDIDMVFFSTTLLPFFILHEKVIFEKLKTIFPNATIEKVSHHTCHASSSILTSDIVEGTIFVNDGAGSAITNMHNNQITQEANSLGYFNKNKKILNMFSGEYFFNQFADFHGSCSYHIYSKKRGMEMDRNDPKYIGTWDGKVMGLAAYGEEQDLSLSVNKFYKLISEDIGFMPYISFTNRWLDLNIENSAEDCAWLLQKNLQNSLYEYFSCLKNRNYLEKRVCFAGGLFLNVLSNTNLKKSNLMKDMHIPPFTNDSGIAFGAAIYGAFKYDENIQLPYNIALLGKEYSDDEILSALEDKGGYFIYEKHDFDELCEIVSDKLNDNQIIGWFQNRSELGPRALGARSILMSAQNKDNKDTLNLRVKHREYWRPFAGVILEEYLDDYFEDGFVSPYMLYSMTVKPEKRNVIPAITHADNTCRPQTVTEKYNPQMTRLLEKYNDLTGIPILLNTSFNDNGEPIVESPKDAIDSFIKMNIDCLAIGNYVVTKRERV